MLDPDTLYIVENEKSGEVHWVRTPDGVGCYWYNEDDEDAKYDVSPFMRTRHVTYDEFDELREY